MPVSPGRFEEAVSSLRWLVFPGGTLGGGKGKKEQGGRGRTRESVDELEESQRLRPSREGAGRLPDDVGPARRRQQRGAAQDRRPEHGRDEVVQDQVGRLDGRGRLARLGRFRGHSRDDAGRSMC